MGKISKKDKRMLEKFRAYLMVERKNRVLPTDGMTEIPLKTGTLQIPKGAICVTTCKLRDEEKISYLEGLMEDVKHQKNVSERNIQSLQKQIDQLSFIEFAKKRTYLKQIEAEQHKIRKLCLENKIVFIYAGAKRLVNWEKFCEYLNGTANRADA